MVSTLFSFLTLSDTYDNVAFIVSNQSGDLLFSLIVIPLITIVFLLRASSASRETQY